MGVISRMFTYAPRRAAAATVERDRTEELPEPEEPAEITAPSPQKEEPHKKKRRRH
jgi:hypothetical protein